MSSTRTRTTAPVSTSGRTMGRGSAPSAGQVAFVGAGPGDAGLLTLRAVERLREADIVIVDQLPRETLLGAYCPDGVEVVDAGFGQDGVPMTRAARAKLVAGSARGGGRVVRLVDGDPATFPGLADEIAACRKADVPFEIVPGVSIETAVPTYAGVPLTPAGVSGVHVVRPHAHQEVDWSAHAVPETTVVVVGDAADIAHAAQSLVEHGLAPSTAVAVTSQGTTVAQRTLCLCLGDVPGSLGGGDLSGELTAVIGSAVDLRDQASWYETKPLFGDRKSVV